MAKKGGERERRLSNDIIAFCLISSFVARLCHASACPEAHRQKRVAYGSAASAGAFNLSLTIWLSAADNRCNERICVLCSSYVWHTFAQFAKWPWQRRSHCVCLCPGGCCRGIQSRYVGIDCIRLGKCIPATDTLSRATRSAIVTRASDDDVFATAIVSELTHD